MIKITLKDGSVKEIEKAILECQDMYINYWDLIEKQNKKKNRGIGLGD